MNISVRIADTLLKNSFPVPERLLIVKNAAAPMLKNNFLFLPLLLLILHRAARLRRVVRRLPDAVVTANAAARIEAAL